MKLGNNEMYLKTSTKGRESMVSMPLIELQEIGTALDRFLESIPLENRVILSVGTGFVIPMQKSLLAME